MIVSYVMRPIHRTERLTEIFPHVKEAFCTQIIQNATCREIRKADDFQRKPQIYAVLTPSCVCSPCGNWRPFTARK